MPKSSDSTAAGRLRVPRSAIYAELIAVERAMLAHASVRPRKPDAAWSAKYKRLTDRRASLLRLLAERDDYILQAFAASLPARFRRDLYATPNDPDNHS